MADYTLIDLEAAKDTLAALNKRFDNYSGNNPDKFQSDIRPARAKVRDIEAVLKASGAIPRSEQEQIEHLLDSKYPNARSKEIVEHEGKNISAALLLLNGHARESLSPFGINPGPN